MLHRCLKRGSERGSSLVEGALIYGVFIFMLIATIDVGYVLFMHQAITERARAALRYGATRAYNSTTVDQMKNLIVFNNATPERQATSGIFGLTPSNVQVSRSLGGAPWIPDQLTVEVNSLRFRFLTPLISGQRIARTVSITVPIETP